MTKRVCSQPAMRCVASHFELRAVENLATDQASHKATTRQARTDRHRQKNKINHRDTEATEKKSPRRDTDLHGDNSS